MISGPSSGFCHAPRSHNHLAQCRQRRRPNCKDVILCGCPAARDHWAVTDAPARTRSPKINPPQNCTRRIRSRVAWNGGIPPIGLRVFASERCWNRSIGASPVAPCMRTSAISRVHASRAPRRLPSSGSSDHRSDSFSHNRRRYLSCPWCGRDTVRRRAVESPSASPELLVEHDRACRRIMARGVGGASVANRS